MDDLFGFDADIEQFEFEDAARGIEAEKASGLCRHYSTAPADPERIHGIRKCLDCGRDDLPSDHVPGDRAYGSRV